MSVRAVASPICCGNAWAKSLRSRGTFGGVEGRRGYLVSVANAEHLPFGDGEFDLIHSKDSLHHMDDPERALTECRRVLKPGGAALIVEANRYNPIFFVHMTKMLGHDHFSRKRFHTLVSSVFPVARFGSFEARFVPAAQRILKLQEATKNLLEWIPGYSGLVAYNFAVARL